MTHSAPHHGGAGTTVKLLVQTSLQLLQQCHSRGSHVSPSPSPRPHAVRFCFTAFQRVVSRNLLVLLSPDKPLCSLRGVTSSRTSVKSLPREQYLAASADSSGPQTSVFEQRLVPGRGMPEELHNRELVQEKRREAHSEEPEAPSLPETR